MSTAIRQGIQVLIRKAVVDAEFRALLLTRRAEAAKEIGLKLSPAEEMLLATVPAAQVEAIIARTSVPEEHRRAFLGHAAAAMLAALGMTSGCAKEPPTTGIRPDEATNNGPDGDWNKEVAIEVVQKLARDQGAPASMVKAIVQRSFSFLMQINLAEVSRFDLEQLLPKRGILHFFLSCINQNPTEAEKSQVLFTPDDRTALRPTEAPTDLAEDQLYRGFKLNPGLEWTIPSPDEIGLEKEFVESHLGLWDTLYEEVAAAQGFAPYYQPIHRLLGHPQLIQTPGLADGTRLLLQVDSDCVFDDKGFPRTGMTWGDAGRVYYLIGETDLKAHHLDSGEARWECH